jgi:molecular chaperone DnaK (HSP70)
MVNYSVSSYGVGIDLGTSFVAAALVRSGQIELATLGERSWVTPSVVFIHEDGTVITGEAAERRALCHPRRAAREFKRRIGDATGLVLGGTPYSAPALLGQLLTDVVHKVTEQQGARPDRIVLTHPANWGPYQRERFAEVPRFGGLDQVGLVSESEAAAAYYGVRTRLDHGDLVAVYDLGGGTFDATVLRKRSDGFDILGTPEGIERLGGIDFDEAIVTHVNQLLDGALDDLDPRDPRTAAVVSRLRQDCMLAKEVLSVDTETTIPVFLRGCWTPAAARRGTPG